MSLHLIFLAALALAAVCAAPAPAKTRVADAPKCVYSREDSNEKNSACYKKCMEKYSPEALLENPRGELEMIYLFCHQPGPHEVRSMEQYHPSNNVN